MLGFGSPDALGIPDGVYDYGFGDPPPAGDIVDIDWGFGDVPVLPPEFIVSPYLLPDDGGVLVGLTGGWPIVGPYHVQLYQSATGQEFPDSGVAPGSFAPLLLSGLGKIVARGSPYWCYTGIKPVVLGGTPGVPESDGILYFVLPHVPCGVYDIKVSWGSLLYPPPESADDPEIVSHLFNADSTLVQAVRIIYRGRSQEQWRIREDFPTAWATGARGPRLETLLIGPGA